MGNISSLFGNNFKNSVKTVLRVLHLDLTKNAKYDRLTQAIIKDHLSKNNGACVDIGAHKGEILDLFIQYAPNVKHHAFEPIPELNKELNKRYDGICHIYPFALSNEEGTTTFHLVKNAPAYSGIKKRDYDGKNVDIEKIQVELKQLDQVIPEEKVSIIKIDVEGAEFLVLEGAKEIIRRSQPIVIFEFGLGASDHYGTTPGKMFDLFTELNLDIFTLPNFSKSKEALSLEEFTRLYEERIDYYFVASPKL